MSFYPYIYFFFQFAESKHSSPPSFKSKKINKKCDRKAVDKICKQF